MNAKNIVTLLLLIGLVGLSVADPMEQYMTRLTFVNNNTNQPITNATIIATPDAYDTFDLLCWFYGRSGDICHPPDLPPSNGITDQNGAVDLSLYDGLIYNLTVIRTDHLKIVTTGINNYVVVM